MNALPAKTTISCRVENVSVVITSFLIASNVKAKLRATLARWTTYLIIINCVRDVRM